MTQFKFGPVNTTTTAAPQGAPTPAPAAAGFAPAGMANPAQAAAYYLQGFAEAEIDARKPFLPPDGQFDCLVQEVRVGGLDPRSKVGFCVYIDVDVKQSNIGIQGERSHRISGFQGKGVKFSMGDLKQFLCTLLADQGLTPEWRGEGLPPLQPNENPDPWVRMFNTVCANPDMYRGKRLFCATSSVQGEVGKAKTKAVWYPPQV